MIVIIIFSRMHFKRILPLWEIQWRIEEEEESILQLWEEEKDPFYNCGKKTNI